MLPLINDLFKRLVSFKAFKNLREVLYPSSTTSFRPAKPRSSWTAAAVKHIALDSVYLPPSYVSRTSLLRPKKSSIGNQFISLFHDPSLSSLQHIVSKLMGDIRSFYPLERYFLQKFTLLPSIVRTLTEKNASETLRSEAPKSDAIVNIVDHEFLANSPSDLISKIEGFQTELTRRLEDLKRFARGLIQQDASNVTFQFVNGKLALQGNANQMRQTVSPILHSALPWASVFPLSSNSSNTISPTNLISSNSLNELSSEWYAVPSSQSFDDSVGLREHFSHLSDEELEVFTAWSDLSHQIP